MESASSRSVRLASRSRSVELGRRPKHESSSTVARGVAQTSKSVSLSRSGREGRAWPYARLGELPLSFHVADMRATRFPLKDSSTAHGRRRPTWLRWRKRQTVWRETPKASAVRRWPWRHAWARTYSWTSPISCGLVDFVFGSVLVSWHSCPGSYFERHELSM